MKLGFFLALILMLSACQPIELTSTFPPTGTPNEPTKSPSPTPKTISTATPTVNTPLPTPGINPFEICSPLEEETIETLSLILVNPLNIPGFGQDTGHHGVDFAYFRRGERESIQGIEIYAILPGKTITSLAEGFPYGNAIIIETPLSQLPPELQQLLLEGYLPVPDDPHYRLDCPPTDPPPITDEYSVYHLYAHMESQPPFNTGEIITCGMKLGTVGNSGDSTNPHLHLETRLGPSGAQFSSMAHYENTCTIEEMANYCLWRMSGYYQLFDPFLLFEFESQLP